MKRLMSLDVFRGATILGMILVNNPGSWSYIYKQLGHAPWHGWTFTDVIFPFFLFIVGVAIVYAFSKKVEAGAPKAELYKKIIRRTIIIFALGIFLNGFPYYNFSEIRIMGVLQRIALCYFFASIIFLHFNVRMQVIWAFALLVFYWAFMALYPVPGIGAGVLEPGKDFASYFDRFFLEGHMWSVSKIWDPEGLFSTIPAISTTLFGVLAGHWLRSKREPRDIILGLLLLGNVGILAGLIWGEYFPINKNIWTSSYVILMAGLASVTLAFCYYLIDIKGYKKFTQPFLVYGMNAITVFVLSGIVARLLNIITVSGPEGTSVPLKAFIYQSIYVPMFGHMNGSLAFAITFIFVMYLLMLILYKKKIFIKI
jgi:predicted acyltransferase